MPVVKEDRLRELDFQQPPGYPVTVPDLTVGLYKVAAVKLQAGYVHRHGERGLNVINLRF